MSKYKVSIFKQGTFYKDFYCKALDALQACDLAEQYYKMKSYRLQMLSKTGQPTYVAVTGFEMEVRKI